MININDKIKKSKERLEILRIRLHYAKQEENYGKCSFISGQIFEQELILEELYSIPDITTPDFQRESENHYTECFT